MQRRRLLFFLACLRHRHFALLRTTNRSRYLQTHTKAVIKEGERIHYHAMYKKQALEVNPGATIRVDTGSGMRELIEGDM